MRCIIIKNVGNQKRWYWCETGTGLAWMESNQDVWVYESKQQAQTVSRACRLGKDAKIIPYEAA